MSSSNMPLLTKPSSKKSPAKKPSSTSFSLQRLVYRSMPRVVRKQIARTCPLAVDQFDVELFDGHRLRLGQLEKSVMLRKLFWQGVEGHEPNSVRAFYKLSERARVVLDIGAFFGLYGMISSKASSTAEIHCFEPFPANAEMLQQFVKANDLENVQLQQKAVSDEVGTSSFHIPVSRSAKLPDIGSLTDRFENGRYADRDFESIDVECCTIDSFCEQQGIETVDLMKIDTEEAELQVVQGGSKTLQTSSPDILCEVVFSNPSMKDLEELLKSFGYRFYALTDGRIRENPTLLKPLEGDTDERLNKKTGGYTDMLFSVKSEDELNRIVWGGGAQSVQRVAA